MTTAITKRKTTAPANLILPKPTTTPTPKKHRRCGADSSSNHDFLLRVHRATLPSSKIAIVNGVKNVDRFMGVTLLNQQAPFATDVVGAKQKRQINKLKKMLLATTELIEHYAADTRRKNDPIVLAHVAVAEKSRRLLARLA